MLLGESVFSSISAASSLEEPVLAAPSVVKEEDPLEDLFRTTFGEQVEPHSLQVHGSVMDSVFESPHDAPMFQDTEMPTWEPLFQDTQDASTNEASDAELLALLDEVSPSGETVSEKAITAPVAPAAAPAIAPSPAPLKNSSSTSSPADSASPASPASKKVKLDKFGCIAYTRKQRNSPLPPVVAEGHDVASVKRARNTEAARRSRARKMKRMMQLEDKCENLVRENEELKAEIEALKRRLA